MSRRGNTTPLLNDRAWSPSPAREALQCNLDSRLTLNKKKSWFGAARYFVHKGALHAKGYVDLIRGEPSNTEKSPNDHKDVTCQRESEKTKIFTPSESTTSTTPLKSSRQHNHRDRTLTPRSAVSSLRQHLSHGSKNRRRQSTACGLFTGENIGSVGIEGPENLSYTEQDDTRIKSAHQRRSSVAASIAGSIRGLTKRASGLKHSSPIKDARAHLPSPTKDPAKVPLPSSPIDIPSLAPSLSLNLGPSDFMHPGHGSLPWTPRGRRGSKMLTSPADFIPGKPPAFFIYATDQLSIEELRHATMYSPVPLTPGGLLQLHSESSALALDRRQITPMPGTNLGLEVDGHSKDALELFERSVESKGSTAQRKIKSLRSMSSLDAVAKQSTPNSFGPNVLETGKHGLSFTNEGKDHMSDSTIEFCPSDMQEITRQVTRSTQNAGLPCNLFGGERVVEDPFTFSDGTVEDDTSPSGKTFQLPFRPKILVDSIHTTEPEVSEGGRESKPVQEGFCESPTHRSASVMESERKDSVVSAMPAKTIVVSSTDATRPKYSATRCASPLSKVTDIRGSHEKVYVLDSSEYDRFKTRQLFHDDENSVASNAHGDSGSMSANYDYSPWSELLVPSSEFRNSVRQNASNETPHSRTVHSDEEIGPRWKFCAKHWLHKSEDEDEDKISQNSDSDPAEISMASTVTISPGRRQLIGHLSAFEMNNSYQTISNPSPQKLPHHESDARDPSAMPPPLRPALKVLTEGLPSASHRFQPSFPVRDGDFNGSGDFSPREKCTLWYHAPETSDNSTEDGLKDSLEGQHAFQMGMIQSSAENPTLASNIDSPTMLTNTNSQLDMDAEDYFKTPGGTDICYYETACGSWMLPASRPISGGAVIRSLDSVPDLQEFSFVSPSKIPISETFEESNTHYSASADSQQRQGFSLVQSSGPSTLETESEINEHAFESELVENSSQASNFPAQTGHVVSASECNHSNETNPSEFDTATPLKRAHPSRYRNRRKKRPNASSSPK